MSALRRLPRRSYGGQECAAGATRVVLLLIVGLPSPAALHPQSSRLWRPDERAIVSSFAVVDAVAAGPSYYFIAGREGLAIYDHRFDRWEPPVGTADGYPRTRVLTALADPSDDSVWLGTADGLVQYRHSFRDFVRINVPGGVYGIVKDRDSPFAGTYLRAPDGWLFLPTGSVIPRRADRLPSSPLHPLSVREALDRYPFLDARRADLLVDRQLRRFQYTSAAVPPAPKQEVLIGTSGRGALLVDPLTASAEPLEFGLLSEGAGGLLLVPGGVWVGSLGPPRSGFTFVDEGLQAFRYAEGPRGREFRFSIVYDMIPRESEIWAGTDRGLVVLDSDGRSRRMNLDLPDQRVVALASSPRGVWVGTGRGLLFVDAGGARIFQGLAGATIFDLAASGDSVWIASANGLARADVENPDAYLPADVARTPELGGPVLAVTILGDTVVAATPRRLVWRRDGVWRAERNIDGEIGTLLVLEPVDGGVWIGGDRGLSFFRFSDSAFRTFNRPDDLPGRVRDIVGDDSYLWVATEGGLVRFDREALR